MDINTLFQNINIVFIIKVFFLLLLGLYIIFIFMLVSKLRSFDKIILLQGASGGRIIRLLGLVYLFLLLFLFVLALVIV